ncbi:MAG: PAS domain S-box protein, partial [Halobacteria archaeon]|nr:PAS domain S-box protein [Halobacteria archaeon]
MSPEEEPYTAENARKTLQDATHEDTESYEWLNETRGGERIWLDVSVRLADIRGKERFLVTARDITERKEYERMLEELHGVTRQLVNAENRDDLAELVGCA